MKQKISETSIKRVKTVRKLVFFLPSLNLNDTQTGYNNQQLKTQHGHV